MASRKMHQTTVRFGPDLWEEIELEAERAGVSVAQYVRDSALMRVAYMRGREADLHYETALHVVGDDGKDWPSIEHSVERTRSTVEDAAALVAQTAQAIRHTRAVRDEARGRRDETRGRRDDALKRMMPLDDAEADEPQGGAPKRGRSAVRD